MGFCKAQSRFVGNDPGAEDIGAEVFHLLFLRGAHERVSESEAIECAIFVVGMEVEPEGGRETELHARPRVHPGARPHVNEARVGELGPVVNRKKVGEVFSRWRLNIELHPHTHRLALRDE